MTWIKSITDDISDENIDKIFSNLDSNGDKSIDFNEFTVKINLSNYIFKLLLLPQNLFNEISVAGWKQVEKIKRQDIKENEVQTLFNMIDTDNSGFLTMKVIIVNVQVTFQLGYLRFASCILRFPCNLFKKNYVFLEIDSCL